MHKQVSTPVVVAVFVVLAIVLVGLGYYFLRPKPYIPSPGVGGRPMEVPDYGAPRSGGGAMPGSPMPPSGVVPGDVSGLQRGAQPTYPPPPR